MLLAPCSLLLAAVRLRIEAPFIPDFGRLVGSLLVADEDEIPDPFDLLES